MAKTSPVWGAAPVPQCGVPNAATQAASRGFHLWIINRADWLIGNVSHLEWLTDVTRMAKRKE